jgi:hypothetical protein
MLKFEGEKNHDLLLDDYAKEKSLKRYLLTPSLFQHLGLFSTRFDGNQGTFVGLQQSLSFQED